MLNKKIKNATLIEVDGIQMKSKIEGTIYNALKSLGFVPQYESETFIYWKAGRPKTFFYDRDSHRQLRLNMKKLIDMKYTPDFIFMYEGIKVIIEVKGWENDNFSIKKKLFRAYLDKLSYPVVYAEIFTKRQLLAFIQALQEKKDEIKKQKRNMLVRRKRNDCNAVFFDGTNWDEIYELFGVTNKPSVETLQGWIDSDDAIYVDHPILREIAIRKNFWVVKDTVTNLFFQMTDDDFTERYDIIRDGE